jgi:hypothetical protein
MIRLTGPLHLLVRATTIVLVLLALCLVAASQDKQIAPTPTESPVPKSIVKGRVVYEDSSRPVRRSPIILFQLTNQRQELSSATDREGKFEIKDVPAGVYFAMVNSPGIITPLPFMNMTDTGPPESMDRKAIKEYCTEITVDGTSDVTVTVHARRGGAISGKVSYQDGEPAINAEVNVIRRHGKQSSRILTGINVTAFLSLHTDDRGMYRIPALPPGEYVISAAESNTAPGQGGSNRGGGFDDFFKSDALTSTYYGGSLKLEDALPVTIAAGGETRDIDITLPDLALHTIRGLVVTHLDGLPLPEATITLHRKDQMDWFQQSARKVQTDSHGQWVLEGVPDGTYKISAEMPYGFGRPGVGAANDVQAESGPGAARKLVPKEIEITVAGDDVAAAAIELAEGASISGTYTLPNDSESGYLTVRCLYEGESGSQTGRTGGGSGGTFSIESLPVGKILLTANFNTYTSNGMENGESKQFYVKSITLNGKDLTRNPLTVVEGQSIKNIQIAIAADPAQANLQLLDSRGKPMAGKPILVVPVDSPASVFPGDSVMGTTDVNGILLVTGAPGDYFVFVAGPDDPWPPTRDWMNGHSSSAQRIKLDSGAKKTITVTVNP